MPVYDARRAFPPVQGTFSLKQGGETLPQSAWVNPGEKPIKMTKELRMELSKMIGEKGLRVLEQNVGFVEKRSAPAPQVDPIFRFETAWGPVVPRPTWKQDVFSQTNHKGVSHLSNPCTVKQKFFWPTMANENVDGRHRKHPMVVQMPSSVRDMRSWLNLYGEPDPGKIKTGTMTTFEPSTRRFGKEKSRSSSMATKVDGHTWHSAYTKTMTEHYGPRFSANAKTRPR